MFYGNFENGVNKQQEAARIIAKIDHLAIIAEGQISRLNSGMGLNGVPMRSTDRTTTEINRSYLQLIVNLAGRTSRSMQKIGMELPMEYYPRVLPRSSIALDLVTYRDLSVLDLQTHTLQNSLPVLQQAANILVTNFVYRPELDMGEYGKLQAQRITSAGRYILHNLAQPDDSGTELKDTDQLITDELMEIANRLNPVELSLVLSALHQYIEETIKVIRKFVYEHTTDLIPNLLLKLNRILSRFALTVDAEGALSYVRV